MNGIVESTVRAQMEIPGVTAQIVEYRSEGTEFCMNPQSPTLHRRLSPLPFEALANSGSRLTPIGQTNFAPAKIQVPFSLISEHSHILSTKCSFSLDWIEKVTDLPDLSEEDDIIRCLDVQNGRLERCMLWLQHELSVPSLASKLVIESIASLIAVELSRYLASDIGHFRVRTQNGKMTEAQLAWVKEYVEAFSEGYPTVQEISNAAGISYCHLRRAFRGSTGMTLRQYIEQVRLKKIEALLTGTDLPLKEIAFRMGFSSPTALGLAFRKISNETPKAYRNRTRRQPFTATRRSH